MPQQVLNPLTEYGRSGGIFLVNPTERVNQVRYLKTAAELRSAPVIRGTPPTYVAPQPSVLTTVAPTSGPQAGSTGVTLTGTGFIEASAVLFGGTPATGVIIGSSTSITCLTPPHAPGLVDVVVIDAAGNGTKVNAYTFT